jgi:hypothetical protein
MPSSNPTTGRNTQAKVVLSEPSLTLVMSNGTNVNEALTATVTATVEDVSGATQSGTIYWASSHPSVATVDLESGLITAVSPGVAIIEASTPALGNSINLWNTDGTPHNKVSAELTVTVADQPVLPDFWFLVQSLGGNQYQIQQVAETNVADFSGTVTYTLGATNAPGGPAVLGTITGSGGALDFTSASSNFIVTGTWILDGKVQTFHQVWSNWGSGVFPVMSVRGSGNGFGAQGYSGNNSGAPYTG